MFKLLKFLVESLVGDGAEVSESDSSDRIEYTIKADENSIAKIIGKKGATVKMLRSIVRVRATLEKKAFYINVVEK
ncbi:KH domain-containing protein [Patescibacteria group bacterium]